MDNKLSVSDEIQPVDTHTSFTGTRSSITCGLILTSHPAPKQGPKVFTTQRAKYQSRILFALQHPQRLITLNADVVR